VIWALILVGAIYGCAAALAMRRFSDRRLVRRTVNRILAHLMELQLFLDSPSVVLRAQRDLLRENFRLLSLVLPASLIPLVIFVALFPQLDAAFGHAPLRVGERTVVTAQDTGALEAPPGIVLETPGVVDLHDQQVSWRVRPAGKTSGELTLHLKDGQVLMQRIVAGPGLISEWRLPFRRPAIEIRYPRISLWGENWMLWFFAASMASGFATALGWKR
jgi:hypothetical protein